MMKEKILLTGGSGFLGYNLLNRFIKEKISYIAISKHGDKNKGIYKLDLSNISKLKQFMSSNRFSIVIHLAGYVNLDRNYDVAKKCFEDNVLGTLNLLEACKETPLKRFIYSSTEEIYGNTTIPYVENRIPLPPSPYSISKLTSENLICYYSNNNHFESVILRLATTYGPYMNRSKFISKTIIDALSNKSIELNSGGKKRNYIYIDDVINAILLSCNKPLPKNTITINVGQEKAISLSDFINKILNLSNSRSKVLYGAIPERISESSIWLMDLSLAKKVLNWSPKIDLGDGLRRTINFYKNDKFKHNYY